MAEDKDQLVDMLFNLIKDDSGEEDNKQSRKNKSPSPRSSPRSRMSSRSSRSSSKSSIVSRKSSISSRSSLSRSRSPMSVSRSPSPKKRSVSPRKSSSSRSRSRTVSKSRSRSRSSSNDSLAKNGITREVVAVIDEDSQTKKFDVKLPNFKYKEKHVLKAATSDLPAVFSLSQLKVSHPTFCSMIENNSSGSESEKETERSRYLFNFDHYKSNLFSNMYLGPLWLQLKESL